MQRRLPPARSITLEQKRLFIFPTAAGFLFLAMLLIMLLTAINYQNNLAYGLTFWLAMLFVIAVHFTHANLMKLSVTAVAAEPVFPGQQSAFVLQLDPAGRKAGHHAVQLIWPKAVHVVDVSPCCSERVSLYLTVAGRGWYTPPRLKVISTYPLGLLRCWSFVYLDARALVYPKPIMAPSVRRAVAVESTTGITDTQGLDDLAGFQVYRPGDPPRHIDWRSWARGQPLQTRLYASQSQQYHWLDFDDFEAGTTEQRLSWLCSRALECEKLGDDYGLRLPGFEIAKGKGDRHRERVLRALALYGIDGGDS